MTRKWLTAVAVACLYAMLGVIALAQPYADATHYDIRIELDTDRDILHGTQIVRYVNHTDEPVGELLFFLMANWGREENPHLHPALTEGSYAGRFDPTWTNVTLVNDADGHPLPTRLAPTPPFLQTYSLDDGLLFVSLPAPLMPGEDGTLHMAFETKFARGARGDQCVTEETYVWRFGWNPIAMGRGLLDGQFLLPSAIYDVELILPGTLRAYGGADTQAVVSDSVEAQTIQWGTERPVRSVPLVIGPELQVVSITVDGVRLESVYRPGGESFARQALSHAAEILQDYSMQYGRYSGTRVVIAESPTPGLFGMAADGMILVGADAVHMKDMPALGAYDRINEYLIAHELAHLWWGIGIGADFNAENWISEGFAEYLSIGYFEQRYGAFSPNLLSHLQPGLIESLLSSLFGPLNLRQHLAEMPYLALLKAGFDEPIVQPLADSAAVNGLTIRTYNKGYLVLRSLEAILGDDSMQQFLWAAHSQWAGKSTSVEALRALAEQVSGRDLSEFFNEWVLGAAQSDAAVHGFHAVSANGQYIADVDVTGPHRVFPLVLQAMLEDGSMTRKTLDPGHGRDPVRWETPSQIVSVTVDPDEMLPDSNRFNNHWPRRIQVTHPFESADRMSMIYPLDAYVVDISLFGVSGGFRNDHAWAAQLAPSFGPNPSLDGLATLQASLGRSDSITITASFAGLDLSTGEGQIDIVLSAERLGFAHPDVGVAGQYWYPRWRYRITLGVVGALPTPTSYAAWTLIHDDIPSLFMTNTLRLQIGLPGFANEAFGTAHWVVQKRFRLAPQTYLDVTTRLDEVVFGDLPNAFLFSLSEMQAFNYLPMGHHQQFASLELVLPHRAPNPGYALFNLTRLTGVTPSLFIQGGVTEADCAIVCETHTRLEIGAKITLRFPVFLGEALSIAVGYAWPLLGPEGEARAFVEWGAASR